MLELTAPPYADVLALLAALRAPGADLSPVRFAPTTTDGRGTSDLHERRRGQVAHLLLLDSSAADLPLLRALLDEELAARRADSFQGATDALSILSLLLLEHGDATDTWRFWQAKRANFDTWAGGYDLEFVLSWLSPAEILALAAERGDATDLAMLADRELDREAACWAEWRAAVDGHGVLLLYR